MEFKPRKESVEFARIAEWEKRDCFFSDRNIGTLCVLGCAAVLALIACGAL